MTILGVVNNDLLDLTHEFSYLQKRLEKGLELDNISLLKKPGKLLHPGTPVRVNKEGLIDTFDEDPSFFGKIPLRTSITCIPADDPSQRTIGWSMSEKIGVAVVNPRVKGSVRISTDGHVSVMSRPFPGRHQFSLAAFYNDSFNRLDVWVVKIDGERVHNIGCFSTILELFDATVGRENATPEKLCRKAHVDEVLAYDGPKVAELVSDRFWERFIDDLPNMLTVAEIMLS